MNDRIDPHVFARFQNVSEDVDFDFTLFINPRGVRSIRIHMNHIVNVDDCEHFERVLRRTTVFRDLKVILSHSLTIKHLLVVVKVAVRTDWAGVNGHNFVQTHSSTNSNWEVLLMMLIGNR
jgi:hypothetical protein